MYLGISLELLKSVWGQFSFRQFLVPACIYSQCLQAPSNIVNGNYRVLICCSCHFQTSSLLFVYFGFLCFQVSSVSNFCPDTRGYWRSLIQAHLFSCTVGREEHCKQISLVCVGSALSVLTTRLAPAHCVCVFLVYTAQASGCSTGELSKLAPELCVLPRSKVLMFVFLGIPQRHRIDQACILCPSQV